MRPSQRHTFPTNCTENLVEQHDGRHIQLHAQKIRCQKPHWVSVTFKARDTIFCFSDCKSVAEEPSCKVEPRVSGNAIERENSSSLSTTLAKTFYGGCRNSGLDGCTSEGSAQACSIQKE